ncbi:MAG: metallophosphoesterase [Paracoccaceae bacterium]
MVAIPEASAPQGVRIYAIGDVHGRLDLLRALDAAIGDDLARSPVPSHEIVLLGDLIDRGPDSCGVLAWLAETMAGRPVRSVRGNHDQYLLDFLDDAHFPDFESWMAYGGPETLLSYGVDAPEVRDAAAREALHAQTKAAVPTAHVALLRGLPTLIQRGDYAFVHAGIRPGTPLAEQEETVLQWIRHPFLASDAEHEAVIVHGHTPSERVTVRPNRIGVDTGAVFGGPLSCIVLEGRTQRLIQAGGPPELPLGA